MYVYYSKLAYLFERVYLYNIAFCLFSISEEKKRRHSEAHLCAVKQQLHYYIVNTNIPNIMCTYTHGF